MSWAREHIKVLEHDDTVTFRPFGRSTEPIVMSGQKVTVRRVAPEDIKVGDVVLCKVRKSIYLHLVKKVHKAGHSFLIGNNKGGTNGWTSTVYGRMVRESPEEWGDEDHE